MPLRRRRSTTLAALAAITAAGALAFACGIDAVATRDGPVIGADTGNEDHVVVLPPEGGAPLDATADAVLDAAEAGCPTGHGTMVDVRDAGGLSFCIDSTEVTNAEYQKFLDATDGGAVSAFDAGLPPSCNGNTSYSTGANLPSGNLPVVSIDWCDANAYCHWAGKRLCGKRSGRDAGTGEWFAACSKGGTQQYPYPGPYNTAACNDKNLGVKPVASFPGCEGGVSGLFDMVSNVSEMIDDCLPATGCAAVGGDYSAQGECRAGFDYPALSPAPSIGFRCCADSP